METQKEIQLFEAEVKGNIVEVNYSIVDDEGVADISQQIKTKTLCEFISEQGLNLFYLEGDNVVELSPLMFLVDNMFDVVEKYLIAFS